MDQWKFWQGWHSTSRNVYLFSLILFALTLVAFATLYTTDISSSIEWERISEIKEVSVAEDPITVGLFSFSYNLDFNLILESFIGSSLKLSPIGALTLLIVIAFIWVMLLTIISTLERFWYYVGTLLLLVFILLFQLEQLLWFDQVQKIGVIIAFILFLGPTLYFQLFNPNAGLLSRLITFLGTTVVFAAFVALFTEVNNPFITLAYHSIWVPIFLSVLFIIITGHEIISFFIRLVTQNNTPQSSNSLMHVFVLSTIYLSNLTLLMLRNIGTIDWDIVYLDAFWLLAFISIIGIWGFKDREVQYKFLFPFAPLGGLFYLLLGISTWVTIAFLSWQGNDPLLESLEDVIVYCQLGFSSVFLIYLIANFVQPMIKNQRVYAILYRPMHFPYGTVLIVGTIVVVAFLARSGFFAYSQLLSGYYIGIADLHWLNEDLFVAEQYYKLSDQYANDNHRANYSLGALARQQDDPVLTAYYFQEALRKKPTPMAFANSGAAYSATNQYFDALFTLKEGVAAFPDNAYLKNNLAMLYGRTDVLDSALYWLTMALENPETQAAAEVNILGLVGQQRDQITISTDSLITEFVSARDYPPTSVNILLLQAQSPIDSASFSLEPPIPKDSVLTAFDYARLYNFLMQNYSVDTVLLNRVESLTELEANLPYIEGLISALSVAEYNKNQVVSALKKMDRLQSVNIFKRNYYLDIMGLWALEQRAPRAAARYFAQLSEQNYEDSRLKFAVSLTESLTAADVSLDLVVQAWRDVLEDSTLVSFHQLAKQQLTVLTSAFDELEADAERYQWIRYRGYDLKNEQLVAAFDKFEDLSYATVAAYDMLLDNPDSYRKDLSPVIDYLRENEPSLNYQSTIYLEWAWALATITPENVTEWERRIQMLVPLTKQQTYWKTYWKALLAHQLGQEAEAQSLFSSLLGNPFFEPGIVAALQYFYSDQPETIYQYLLDAIQTNPFSAKLLEEYILMAIQVGLENYAEESLSDLKTLVSDEQYTHFMSRYQDVKDQQLVAF